MFDTLSPHKRLSVFTLKLLTFSPWCGAGWLGWATARWSPCSMTPTQTWPSPPGGHRHLKSIEMIKSSLLWRNIRIDKSSLQKSLTCLCGTFVTFLFVHKCLILKMMIRYAPGDLWAQEKYGETRAKVMFSKGGGGNKLKNHKHVLIVNSCLEIASCKW